jgi:hypothetical protein
MGCGKREGIVMTKQQAPEDAGPPYRAEIGGSSWKIGPEAEFQTIEDAREWAESYGSTADGCAIRDKTGRLVAVHSRDPSSGEWYEAEAYEDKYSE